MWIKGYYLQARSSQFLVCQRQFSLILGLDKQSIFNYNVYSLVANYVRDS